jgi:polysaccharide biosynthesis transport protein
MSAVDMDDQRATVTPARFRVADAPSVPATEQLADQDGGMQFRRFLGMLRRRLRLIASIAICGTLAVEGLALFLSRYTALAQIVVEESQAPRIDERFPSQEAVPDQATIQTHVTALSSHDLLGNVIAQLTADTAFRASERGVRGSVPDLFVVGKSMLAIEELKRHLNVFQEGVSHVISVAYTSKDSVEAAAIANKITDYYLASGEDQTRLALDQTVAVLGGKIADLRTESESLDTAVATYQAAHRVKDAAKTNVIDQKLGDLNHQLSAAQTELVARRTRHAELSALRGASGRWDPLLAGLGAEELVDLHSQVLAVLTGRQETIAVIPHAKEASGQGEEASLQGEAVSQPLRDKVRKELDQALLKLSHEERVDSAQVAAIEQSLSAVQSASDDARLRDLVAAAASAQRRYERLVLRRDELLEQRDAVAAPARLLSRAAVPERPSSPNPLLFLAPAGIAFLVIGCLVALLRDRLDQGIYSKNDVASVLGLHCAGFVPQSREIMGIMGMGKGPASPGAPFTEALRGILASLQLVGPRRRPTQVVLITSSVPGEGKTTLAISLAACAARMGAKVLLLDLDTRAEAGSSSTLAHSPREKTAVETIDMFAHDRAPSEAIQTHPGMQLDYLQIRRGPASEPSPLFFGDQMSILLRHRRSNYDLIFIDSAPVLAKAEVRLLASIADQVILAVRWGKTRRDDARAALALLREGGPHGDEKTARISAAITQVDLGRHGRSFQAGAMAEYGQYLAG